MVGELEMLRRENQRLFKELARARESGAEDRKRCENLQVGTLWQELTLLRCIKGRIQEENGIHPIEV